jgi:hypothetical protein
MLKLRPFNKIKRPPENRKRGERPFVLTPLFRKLNQPACFNENLDEKMKMFQVDLTTTPASNILDLRKRFDLSTDWDIEGCDKLNAYGDYRRFQLTNSKNEIEIIIRVALGSVNGQDSKNQYRQLKHRRVKDPNLLGSLDHFFPLSIELWINPDKDDETTVIYNYVTHACAFSNDQDESLEPEEVDRVLESFLSKFGLIETKI